MKNNTCKHYITTTHFLMRGSTSLKALINSSTFYLLKIIGGFIFNTLPFLPSRLTKTCLSRIRRIIWAAVSPSSYLDSFDFTISMPWNNPTPLTSPTKSYFLSYSSFSRKYFPVYLAFYCRF